MVQFKQLVLLVAAAIPLALAAPAPAVGDYYYQTGTPIYRHIFPHKYSSSFSTADEINQAEKRAIGDYYYMGMPRCRYLFFVSCTLIGRRIADETSQVEKRAIGDYYYMGEPARGRSKRIFSLPLSGRDEPV